MYFSERSGICTLVRGQVYVLSERSGICTLVRGQVYVL
jgi:hypothetical protein